MGALWPSCTSTVKPLLSTNLVYLMSGIGLLTLATVAFDALAFAAGLAWAKEDAALKKGNATTTNKLPTRCIDLFPKAFLHRKNQDPELAPKPFSSRFRLAA